MLLAENKYKSLKHSGEWGKLTGEVKILTLNAKIVSLKNDNRPAHSQSKQVPKKEEKKQQDKKDSNKEDKKKEEKKNGDFCWQKSRPNQTTQTVEGNLYHWCPNHQNKTNNEWGQWVRHKPEDCNNKGLNKLAPNPSPNSGLQQNANLAAFDTVDSDSE